MSRSVQVIKFYNKNLLSTQMLEEATIDELRNRSDLGRGEDVDRDVGRGHCDQCSRRRGTIDAWGFKKRYPADDRVLIA